MKVLFVYHCQTAPVPNEPPVCVKVVLLPLQIVAVEALNEVGATEGWFTVTITSSDNEVHPLFVRVKE